ncbi:MAG: hypothetical protein ACP5IO_05400 [Elusimicrobiales bacterium]
MINALYSAETGPQDKGLNDNKINIKIENIFSDSFRIYGWANSNKNIDLQMINRTPWPNASEIEYEITGQFMDKNYDYSNPLLMKKFVFGNTQKLTIADKDRKIEFEKIHGFNSMDIKFNSIFDSQELSVIKVISNYFAHLKIASNSFKNIKADKKSETPSDGSLRFTTLGNLIYVEGENTALRIEKRNFSFEDNEYLISSSLFGEHYTLGDFTIRTNKRFLGTNGFEVWIKEGLKFELRYNTFGNRKTAEIRGLLSAHQMFIIFSLFQYLNYF